MTGTPAPQGFGTLPEELDTRENTVTNSANLGYGPSDDSEGNRTDSLLRPPSESGGGGSGRRHQSTGTRAHTSTSTSSPLRNAPAPRGEAQAQRLHDIMGTPVTAPRVVQPDKQAAPTPARAYIRNTPGIFGQPASTPTLTPAPASSSSSSSYSSSSYSSSSAPYQQQQPPPPSTHRAPVGSRGSGSAIYASVPHTGSVAAQSSRVQSYPYPAAPAAAAAVIPPNSIYATDGGQAHPRAPTQPGARRR